MWPWRAPRWLAGAARSGPPGPPACPRRGRGSARSISPSTGRLPPPRGRARTPRPPQGARGWWPGGPLRAWWVLLLMVGLLLLLLLLLLLFGVVVARSGRCGGPPLSPRQPPGPFRGAPPPQKLAWGPGPSRLRSVPRGLLHRPVVPPQASFRGPLPEAAAIPSKGSLVPPGAAKPFVPSPRWPPDGPPRARETRVPSAAWPNSPRTNPSFRTRCFSV
mmetsp:Transcript_15237/g.34883  ORF Transcript_15237/g.34883 Transcript_15237/m.34883 type:complete len:218 (-) Transcript_15237:1459-2112(-)